MSGNAAFTHSLLPLGSRITSDAPACLPSTFSGKQSTALKEIANA
jgi:hypothetical protein